MFGFETTESFSPKLITKLGNDGNATQMNNSFLKILTLQMLALVLEEAKGMLKVIEAALNCKEKKRREIL